MGPKHLSFDVDVARGIQPRRPLVEGVPSAFEALLDVFSPRIVDVMVDDRRSRLERGAPGHDHEDIPLWFDEEVVEDQTLTKCWAGGTGALVHALGDRLARESPGVLAISAVGALRHRPPGMDIAWYGRWKITDPLVLWELAEVRIEAAAEGFWFSLDLPLYGYPLTSTRLGTRSRVEDGDPAVAAANRAAIIPILGRVPESLGFETSEVRWSTGGDGGPVHPADARDIEDVWLPRLRAG
jgi:hypothetical protein